MADKVIFIDRDGVINVDLMGDYVKTVAEFAFEAGAVDALKALCDAGYKIIVISNQAGIGDGAFSLEALNEVQAYMENELKKNDVQIADTFYCLHGKQAGCGCRKPKTGLFELAEKKFDFDKSETYFIGDKATDIEAGKSYGLKTLFVKTGHGIDDEPKLVGSLTPDIKAENLDEGVRILLS